jgi:alcohol dehydrogenase class IV
MIYFGAGVFSELDKLIRDAGGPVLLVTGSKSFKSSKQFGQLLNSLKSASMKIYHCATGGEPSPDTIDEIVGQHRDKNINLVCGIGGGSVLDTGKAVSAMLYQEHSVCEYLEGVGNKSHDGRKVPYIAVPSTAGTGSEVTKNAVLSKTGEGGFKKSLRHDNFVPDIAVVDPELTITCPPALTAACGMDAFTQLLEAYVSTKSSPLTDALAFSGLMYIKDNLVEACGEGAASEETRAGMAYASLMSGIVLANAGLGTVHGFASPIGGLHNIPHGIVCGTLVGETTLATIRKLRSIYGLGHEALAKYANIGRLLSGKKSDDVELNLALLVQRIDTWIEQLQIPGLGTYGISGEDLGAIVERTGNKNNPVELDKDEMFTILVNRL